MVFSPCEPGSDGVKFYQSVICGVLSLCEPGTELM